MTRNFWGPFSGSYCLYSEVILGKLQFSHGNTAKTHQNLGISFHFTCLHFTPWFSFYCKLSIEIVDGLLRLCLEPGISKCSVSWICEVFNDVLEQVSDVTLNEQLDYLCSCMLELRSFFFQVCCTGQGYSGKR